eukprot:CAMPEP_0170944196 /NCGR_PEP_ID=MMETSP0735-20130129/25501_1 /TAXON_ID=186038 /ORGANISM="Fragilariopsis kerguelensis, Strain L26-C5" /LENGTH=41 /DNA_ID= /DNA_START= /DNA_END= /DNA_ORIENTATION=
MIMRPHLIGCLCLVRRVSAPRDDDGTVVFDAAAATDDDDDD